MTVSAHCKRIRRLTGLIRCHLSELRGAVPADELMEAQRHLLGLTVEINRAEARQHEAPRMPDRKQLAGNDTD